MWVLFGILQLYTNYNFVVQDLVSVMRKKKEEIKKFVEGSKQGLYDYSPYDDPRNIAIADCVLPTNENNV